MYTPSPFQDFPLIPFPYLIRELNLAFPILDAEFPFVISHFRKLLSMISTTNFPFLDHFRFEQQQC